MSVEYSIIIPAYNEELSVVKTLGSIYESLGEFRNRVEIILVDGCSNDDTIKKANEFFASHPMSHTIIELEEQSYPGSSRNRGIEKATSDNLIFIDCGITVGPDFFTECFAKSDGSDAVWFKSEFKFDRSYERAYIRPYFSGRENRRFLRHCMIKRSVFNKTGLFREDLRAAEDWLYYQEISKAVVSEYFSPVGAVYSGYPNGITDFYKKWTTYFQHSVAAGIYMKNLKHSIMQMVFILLVILAGVILSLHWAWALAAALVVYIIARGMLSFYRSKIPIGGVWDFLYTFITSVALEESRLAGVLSGLIKKKK